MNLAMSYMYRAGFWLPRSHGVKLGEWMLCFLQSYQKAAYLCNRQAYNRFSLMPKLHFLHHDSLKLIHSPDHCQWLINPLSTSNQMQEDYVGKPSRLARRVAVPLLHKRVMDRSLICAFEEIQRADQDERGLI